MRPTSSIEELAASFQSKVALLRQKLDLRELDTNNPPGDVLQSIESDLSQLKVLLAVMRAENTRRRTALDQIEEHKDTVARIHERVEHAAANLPAHLPSRVMPPPPPPADPPSVRNNQISCTPKQKRFMIPETPSDLSANTPSIEQIKRKSQTLFVPALDFITTDEFEAVPKYMKGRLTYSQVNSAVEEFNKALDVKYSALAVPRMKRSEKVKAACRTYKEQENKDTKGVHFVVEADLKANSKLRMDKATHTLLTVLRHSGRIKEVRSKGLIRYAVAGMSANQ